LVSCAANAADLTAEPTRVLGIRVRGGHGISLTHYVHVLSGVVNVDARAAVHCYARSSRAPNKNKKAVDVSNVYLKYTFET
jgi:hypothetical protein